MKSAESTQRNVGLLLGCIALLGVLLQLWLSVRLALSNGHSPLSGVMVCFSYFTVLTNTFIVLVCVWPRRWFEQLSVAGCATTSILVVGLTYHLLLRHLWAPQGAQWVADMTLHYVVPAGAIAYWFLRTHRLRLAWTAPLLWSIYPLAYLGYSLVRGELMAVYPYPFIDVGAIGYRHMLLNSAGLLIVFLVIGLAVVGVSRLRRPRVG